MSKNFNLNNFLVRANAVLNEVAHNNHLQPNNATNQNTLVFNDLYLNHKSFSRDLFSSKHVNHIEKVIFNNCTFGPELEIPNFRMTNLQTIELNNCKGNTDTAIASILSHKYDVAITTTPTTHIDTTTASHNEASVMTTASTEEAHSNKITKEKAPATDHNEASTTTTVDTHHNKLIDQFVKEEKGLSLATKIDHTVATIMNTIFNEDLSHNKPAQELLSYVTSHCEIPTDTKDLIIESLSSLNLNADFSTELLCNLTGNLHISE